MRDEATAQGRKPGYNRSWRDRTDGPENKPFVIRIKMPLTGFTSWNDAVQGRIDYPNDELEDMVLLRADGTPVYNLAVVVDDADMGITHVIRGDDHINNTPKQIALYNALGLPVPTFAHIPLIHGADGRKMSKRDGAASVLTYRDEGYLPEAVCNYLLRLGWSHKDEEIMTRDRAIELFDVHAINTGAAVFDRNKLDWLNAHYLREMPISALIEALQPFFAKLDLAIAPAARAHLEKGLPSLTKRAKHLTDLAEAAQFYLSAGAPALTAEAKAVLEGSGKENLRFAISLLTDDIAWDSHHLQERVKVAVAEKGLKIQDVAQPLRAALTGSTVSPSVFEIMEVLGRGESLSRLKSAAG
jgi:glutamyl-tRNA synthetase